MIRPPESRRFRRLLAALALGALLLPAARAQGFSPMGGGPGDPEGPDDPRAPMGPPFGHPMHSPFGDPINNVSPAGGSSASVEPPSAPRPAPGYLGVDISGLNSEKAQSLKLKDSHGALISLIDHDAPAAQAGLRPNDVVLSVNGKGIDSPEQLRRILRSSQAGQKLTLSVSRDGAPVSITLQLADRKVVEQEARNKISSSTTAGAQTTPTAENGKSGFHFPGFGGQVNVGATVEPLTAQMADYLGLPKGGVMIRQVAGNSLAESAGLREHDVILKVGAENIAAAEDWQRALRANKGRQTALSILRDKKPVTLTLQLDARRN